METGRGAVHAPHSDDGVPRALGAALAVRQRRGHEHGLRFWLLRGRSSLLEPVFYGPHLASSSVALAYAQYVASDSWDDASAKIASSSANAAGALPPSYDRACAS